MDNRRATLCLPFLLLWGCLLLSSQCKAAEEDPTVTIKQGTLRGKIHKTISNKDIFSFTGIPYAKPPLGPLRFKLAEPAGPWKGELDATRNRSRCAQLRYPDLHYVGEEDCLFMNVYTTKLSTGDKEKQLAPVIAYIHGGLFVHSSGDLDIYDPKILLDQEPGNLVFVTFNYRLGVVGFLSTEDEVSPGNNGLKDQVLALKWIRDNIAAFGGDPKRVTLMGDNAGAVSAHFHMISPLSKGLFQYAISQSGTALSHWALNRDPLGRTQYLAELVDCGDNTTSSHDIVACLRDVDLMKLVKKSNIVLKWRTDWIVPFCPSVETEGSGPAGSAFLPDLPRDMMQRGEFHPVPWLVGVTSHDGLPHSLQLMLFQDVMADLNEEFEKYAPYYFELDGELERAKEAAKLIREYYFQGGSVGMSSQLQLANLHTDYYYFTSLVKSAALHVMADAPPVYIYHFSYQNRNSRVAIGVPQGDDTQYILPRDSGGRFEPEEGTDEMRISRRLVTLVTNFATLGQPIPDGDTTFGVSWPPVDNKVMNFIDFNKEMSLNETFYKDRIAFWNDIDDLLETGHSVLRDGPEKEEKDEL